MSNVGAAAVFTTLFVSIAFGSVFLVVGHLWDGLIEMIRVGNTHMSYCALRLGWRQYSSEVFVAAVLLFWCAVIISYRAARSPGVSRDELSVGLNR